MPLSSRSGTPRSRSPPPRSALSQSRSRSRSQGRSLSRRSRTRSRSRSVEAARRDSLAQGQNGHDVGRGRAGRNNDNQRYPRLRSPSTPSRSSSVLRSSTTKVVVEHLTKNINKDHLQEIFGQYGTITGIILPENPIFLINRGTAYINYETEEEALKAIENMHGGSLDGNKIDVSVCLPRRRFSRSPPPSRRVVDYLERGPRGGGPGASRNGPAGNRYPSPPPPRNDARGFRGGPPRRGGREPDTWRRRSRSVTRSRSPPRRYDSPPRRRHSPEYSPRRSRSPRRRPRSFSRSRTPPRRRRDISPSRSPPPRRGSGGGGRRGRSPSYSSYDSRSRSASRRRSRSLSPGRERSGRGMR